MTTHESRILSVTVRRNIDDVCAYLCEPKNFPQWASGLAGGLLPASNAGTGIGDGGDTDTDTDPPSASPRWAVKTPQGEVTLRFSPANRWGVADHWVGLADGTIIYVPLRAVANGDGSEVMLTLFRLPSMDARRFEEDAQWVMRDLRSLKSVLEAAAWAASEVPHS